MMPTPPDVGWHGWFLDHPYQRMRIPVARPMQGIRYITSEEGGGIPWPDPSFDIVDIWYDPPTGKVCACVNDGKIEWVQPPKTTADWSPYVDSLFEYVTKLHGDAQPEPPPEPSGSGWDDFDWSI